MKTTRTARWDITPEGIPAAADIVNLRYKSCSEMEGQDHLFVSTYSCLLYATANSSGYALVGERSTVFDVPLNGRFSPVMQAMNNWCLLYTLPRTGRC
jgi:hypothetical protein